MIRRATIEDVPQLVQLMHELAVFEGYADRFAITPQSLLDRGFYSDEPQFTAWVVDDGAGKLLGYAVIYVVPFTYDLRPTIVLKELFVQGRDRGQRYGSKLFAAIRECGRTLNARLLRWQVLPANEIAKSFYRLQGGEPDDKWENWILELEPIS